MTVDDVLFLHPLTSVPVTVYVLVVVGAKELLSVIVLSQMYDRAPCPLSFVDCPKHNAVGPVITEIVGKGLTVTIADVIF